MNINDYDWNLWLPPGRLPFKSRCGDTVIPGQIWAFHWGHDDYIVGLCVVPNDKWKALARPKYPGSSFYKSSTHHGILIADVDSEPTDPDLLYQFLYK